MKKHSFGALLLLAPALVGCSDINLGDIDTTVSVPVKDMVVPIQLDNVQLSTVLDVDDDSKLREIDGEYAVVIDGDFKSNSVHIDPFTAKAEQINTITGVMDKVRPGAVKAPARQGRAEAAESEAVAAYVLPKAKELIRAYADKVDEAIRYLKEVEADTSFKFDVNVDKYGDLMKEVNAIHLENFAVQLPRGIIGSICIVNADGSRTVAEYSSETGLVSFVGKDITTDAQGNIHIEGRVTGFDANLLEAALRAWATSESNNRAGRGASEKEDFAIKESFGVVSGQVLVRAGDFKDKSGSMDDKFNRLPAQLGYESTGSMDDVTITAVSGRLDYDVQDYEYRDLRLDDVPAMLKQSGTNLRIANPQVYVNLKYPAGANLESCTVEASSKLVFETKSRSGKSRTFSLDESVKASAAEYFFYLSPEPVDEAQQPEEFRGAHHVPFTALSDLLACFTPDTQDVTIDSAEGEGLPETVSISAQDTHVVVDGAEQFQLDRDYFIDGRYAFVAPLALTENSHFKYTEVIDGWGGSVKGIVIEKLCIEGNVTTDVPFELQLRVTPLDADGNAIAGRYSTVIVPAKAQAAPLDLVLEGNITNLDGIKIEALAVSKEASALKPDMNIALGNLKVRVSGRYENEL